ncbi:uncharacterized protein LOC121385992, partial [Gigantopelta aegis]|uniref:uncharacterized protein LOC121385992 n=1 Tax=Gigantopelta aegis TaxID=1735272 RepID=UPI001B88CF1B
FSPTVGPIKNTGAQCPAVTLLNTTAITTDDLQCKTERLLTASVAPNTRLVNETGLVSFQNFRIDYKLAQLWPPELDHVTNFIAFLSVKGYAVSTAKAYITAVGFNCKIKECHDMTQNLLVTKLLGDFKRKQDRQDTRLPITPHILVQLVEILPAVCKNPYEIKLFKAALTLAFCGFLRIGEFTVSSNTGIQEEILTKRDIQFNNDCKKMLLRLRYYKTDQSGKGITLAFDQADRVLCPLHCSGEFLAIRTEGEGPLVCHFNETPLTRYQISAILSKALRLSGLNTQLYKAHSSRIEAATATASGGCPPELIKIAGRLKSSSFKTYIRMPLIDVLNIL